ncbi:MAG: hypothetical protein VX563_07640 [Planctomycetota bacterium]|nr:hypothetical protein [Planctomycetota bacterium]
MPASRSRTHEWKRSLQQLFDRGGAIEFAVVRPDAPADTDDPHDHASGNDLVWRVKVLRLTDREMTVEAPMALGRQIEIESGIELVAAMSIGQNRWMFRTRNLGLDATPGSMLVMVHPVLHDLFGPVTCPVPGSHQSSIRRPPLARFKIQNP